jgi:hypothetical protein
MEGGGARDRLEALERERLEQAARANAAVAAAQDRSYWLDRWNLDLNSVMRRRGASELRAGLRALRAVYRLLAEGSWALRKAARRAPDKVTSMRRAVAEEHERAERMRALAGAPVDRERAVRADLERLGLSPRPGDAWLHAPGALEQLDELRERVAPGGRVVLEADGVSPSELLARCTPQWHISLYLQGDPDVYVLERP